MAVITISRELGTEADQIIDQLCNELGYCRIDKTMLSQIAEEAGVDVKAVLAKERDVSSKPKLISDQMTSLYGRQPGAFARQDSIDDQTYARLVRETLEKTARQGNAVIVGRGGQIILRDWPDALHVQLYAPQEARVQNLVERQGLSKLEAQRRIEQSDEQKRLYIRNMHRNADWKDLKYYHLAIDTNRIPPATVVQMIMLAVRQIESQQRV